MRRWAAFACAAAAGLTGYALTGRPDLPARPTVAIQVDPPGRAAIEAARPLFFDLRERGGGWVLVANTQARAGDTLGAVGTLQDAVTRGPQSLLLWTELGSALSLHAGGGLPPAAELAFDRAQAIDSKDRAPRYFRALALWREGRGGEARAILQTLAEEARPGPLRARLLSDVDAARRTEAALGVADQGSLLSPPARVSARR